MLPCSRNDRNSWIINGQLGKLQWDLSKTVEKLLSASCSGLAMCLTRHIHSLETKGYLHIQSSTFSEQEKDLNLSECLKLKQMNIV